MIADAYFMLGIHHAHRGRPRRYPNNVWYVLGYDFGLVSEEWPA